MATPATKLDVDGTITASGGEVLTTGTLNTKLQAGSGVTLVYSGGDNTLTINSNSYWYSKYYFRYYYCN